MNMPFIRKSCLALLATATLCTGALYQTPRASAAVSAHALDAGTVTSFVDQFFSAPNMEQLQVPGAVVTVVQGEDILLNKGYGYSNVAKKTPVDPEQTLFRVGSITKSLTATALMQLVEQGQVDLEADIQQYMGDIEVVNPFDEPVRVKHLLAHNTGLQVKDPLPQDFQIYDFDAYYPVDEYIQENMPPVVREPGTSYMYDNFASLLQAYIIEQVTDQRYEDYMKDHLFKQLDMVNTHSMITRDNKDKLSTSYQLGQELPVYSVYPTSMPHGGMMTTGADMANFMIAHLNEGQFRGIQILKPETIKQMHEPQHQTHPSLLDTTYGFEAPMQLPIEEYVFTKGGSLPGFISYLWFVPELRLGVFVSMNTNNGAYAVFYQAFMQQFATMSAPPSELQATPREQLLKFEGLYADLRNPGSIYYITAGEDGMLHYLGKSGKHTLKQLDPLSFIDERGLKMVFKESKDGEIAYVKYLEAVSTSAKLADYKLFADVNPESPYAPYISLLQAGGVLTGDQSGEFKPHQDITRAEFITSIMRVLHAPDSPNPSVFKDVQGHQAEGLIQTAVENGIIQGYGQRFRPDDAITRQEAASIVIRILTLYGLVPQEAPLAGKTAQWAATAVQSVLAYGLYGPEVVTNNDGSMDYQSQRAMTREEAALLISSALNL